MHLLSKEVDIRATVEVNTNDRPRQLHIEITATTIRLSHKWNQTEISVKEAKAYPQRIVTGVFACVPEVYVYESEAVVKFIMGNI
ncbi:hypothetical protein CPT_CIP9_178 [Enterobacter phage vB_EclM_CIP9]|uniref:Uncharacterized protein n=1 Tax=Enterobacter phage vB_EclM_CIP9 TaxID=2696340 RepID=A0A6B9Y1I7_9CAUD|nr:hypothetical protein HWD05_gp178 [Enterobacter phage vB_EclM_CIP9]QHS01714.1 hypothetical protein CPT_CIP9_178 [Enterobacter phage vB_EclM_CIP9]